MGNGYNHHHLHQRGFYSKNNSFLPILCRVSIRDVKLKDFRDRSSSFSDDPSSPKVSCMGQVKRNSKVIGFSTPYRLTSSSTSTTTAITTNTNTSRNNPFHGKLKYVKLKRFFSGGYLLSSNTTATAVCSNSSSSSSSNKGICRNGSRRSSKINHDDGGNSHVQQQNVEVNLTELDPPLPVVKKVQPPPEVSLWKRRSGGLSLGFRSRLCFHPHPPALRAPEG